MPRRTRSTIGSGSVFSLGALLLVFLSGCATVSQPPPHQTHVSSESMISTSASVSHTLILDKDSDFVSCTTPPPDAVFSQGESAALQVSSPGGPGEGGSESETSGESGLPGRTPALLIARELFFRACEFSRNYELSKEEATALYTQTLSIIGSGWSKEAANTTVSVGETQLVSGNASPKGSPQLPSIDEMDLGAGSNAEPTNDSYSAEDDPSEDDAYASVADSSDPDDDFAIPEPLPDTTGF